MDNAYKVFIVDDDTKHQLLIKNHFENKLKHKFEISLFTNGEDCLKQIQKKPEAIILDYYLDTRNSTAKDGLKILEKIKNHQPSIPVVIISGQEQMQVAIDAFGLGAYDYVIKNETSLLRLGIIVDKIIAEKRQSKFFEEQKKIRYLLIFIVIALVATVIASAIYF